MLLPVGQLAFAQDNTSSTTAGDGRFPALTKPQFRLMERVDFPGELIRDAVWLDERTYLCLTVCAAGAQIWQCNYETGNRSLLINSDFLNTEICSFPDCLNLSMKISETQRYLFLNWTDAAGTFQWRLLDISDPPFFVMHNVEPPGGMRINDVLFSTDDHYAVFLNNAFEEGSEISLLVIDLDSGNEAWRISTHELSFVRRVWWNEEVSPAELYASADLHNGVFHSLPGLAILDLESQSINFDDERSGLLMGDSAAWGVIGCYRSLDKAGVPYFIRAQIPGHGDNMQVPLSDAPLDIGCLSEPGLMLLRNTLNFTLSQLWMIDLIEGDKLLAAGDCEHFQIGPSGRLLVIPRGSNELHIMQLFLPDPAFDQ